MPISDMSLGGFKGCDMEEKYIRYWLDKVNRCYLNIDWNEVDDRRKTTLMYAISRIYEIMGSILAKQGKEA